LSKTLNYTDTAENLFTTQGNISKQILALEKELGTPLFTRAHRQISLTQQGEITVPFAKKIIRNYTELQVKLNDFQDNKDLTIEIRTIPTMPSYQSFALITQFLKEYPEVHLQLQEEESYNLMTSLKSGKCEMIFARVFNFDDENLERIVMENDEFVAVLPKNHQFAHAKQLDLSKLRDDKFLILGDSTNLYDPVLELCHKAGFKPKITYEGTRVDLIKQMVQNNMGVSLMMQKTAQKFDSQKLAIVPLTTNIANELCFLRVKGKHTKVNDLLWNYIEKENRNK